MLRNSSSTRAVVSGIHLCSCYILPIYTLNEFETIVDNIVSNTLSRKPILIAGEFKVWATDWGCPSTNERGWILLEAFSVLGVMLLNLLSEQTFSRGVSGSVICITIACNSIVGRVA